MQQHAGGEDRGAGTHRWRVAVAAGAAAAATLTACGGVTTPESSGAAAVPPSMVVPATVVSDPAEVFADAVCATAPAAAVGSVVAGAAYSGLSGGIGSWFGDGLTCAWTSTSGIQLHADIYVVPAPDWRSRTPADSDQLELAGEVPFVLTTLTGDRYFRPDGDTAPLVSHLTAAIEANLATLCTHPLDSFMHAVEPDRAAEYSRICANAS